LIMKKWTMLQNEWQIWELNSKIYFGVLVSVSME